MKCNEPRNIAHGGLHQQRDSQRYTFCRCRDGESSIGRLIRLPGMFHGEVQQLQRPWQPGLLALQAQHF